VLCLLFGQVACQYHQLSPRWHHFYPASLPPEYCHFLVTSGKTILYFYKHCFHVANSLVVSRNMLLILIRKIWLLLNLVKNAAKMFLIF